MKKDVVLVAIMSLLSALIGGAITIFLGIGGWIHTSYLQEATLTRDYIQLAVEILREPNRSENSGLREWAVDLIVEYSQDVEVPFPDEVAKQLKEGTAVLPAASITRGLLTEVERQIQDAGRRQRRSLAGRAPLPRRRLDNLVPLLVLLLSDDDETVRSQAASILNIIGNPEAMEALRNNEK